MWVWASIPPGTTRRPDASMSRRPVGERRRHLRAGSGDGHDPFVLHQDLGGQGAGRADDPPSGDHRAHLGLLRV
jgi:hypothetical protein